MVSLFVWAQVCVCVSNDSQTLREGWAGKGVGRGEGGPCANASFAISPSISPPRRPSWTRLSSKQSRSSRPTVTSAGSRIVSRGLVRGGRALFVLYSEQEQGEMGEEGG